MTIGVLFKFVDKIVEVRIDGTNCLFRTGHFNGAFSPIDGLQLDYKGVCREFPDLETKEDWKEIAISRFKDKIKELKTEEERMNYVVEDLKKWGYVPLYKQRGGFRVEKYK
jgi:hypothetical protein